MDSIWMLVLGCVVLNLGVLIIASRYERIGYNRAIDEVVVFLKKEIGNKPDEI